MKNKNLRLTLPLLTAVLILVSIPFTCPVTVYADSPIQTPSPLPDLASITPQNIQDLTLLKRFGQGGLRGDFAINPRDGSIAAIMDGGVGLYDPNHGEQSGFISIPGTPTALAIAPDGMMLAVVYNIPSGKMIEAIDSYFNGPGILPKISFWELPEGKPVGNTLSDLGICGDSNIWDIAFTPDGNSLVFPRQYSILDREKRLCVLSTKDGAILHTVDFPGKVPDTFTETDISPNGKYAVISASNFNKGTLDATIYATGDLKQVGVLQFNDPDANTLSLSFTSDGEHLALGYHQGEGQATPQTVQFYTLPEVKKIFSLEESELFSYTDTETKGDTADTLTALAVSADGKWVASGAESGRIKLWNSSDGQMLQTLDRLIWQPRNFTSVFAYEAHDLCSRIKQVSFSQDGKYLIAAEDLSTDGQSGRISVYQLSDGTKTGTFFGDNIGNGSQGAFSPDSQRIAYGGFADGHAEIWNVADGSPLFDLRGHSSMVSRIVYSAEGKHIATASDDQTIRLWNAQTGDPIHTLSGHSARIQEIAFSADGANLISAAEDHTIRRWKVADGSLIETKTLDNDAWKVIFLCATSNSDSILYGLLAYPAPTTGFIGRTMLWNYTTGKETTIGDTTLTGYVIRLGSAGETFISTGIFGKFQEDGRITIEQKFNSPFGNGALAGFALSPDNRIYVSGNGFGIQAWDIEQKAFIGVIAAGEPTSLYGDFQFSPDGKMLMLANSGQIFLLGVKK